MKQNKIKSLNLSNQQGKFHCASSKIFFYQFFPNVQNFIYKIWYISSKQHYVTLVATRGFKKQNWTMHKNNNFSNIKT